MTNQRLDIPNIIINDIPIEAYKYQVGGKSALEWVIERQSIKIDKDTNIINDANEYANETMKNPSYPLDLFLKIITLSIKTLRIVEKLPRIDFKKLI